MRSAESVVVFFSIGAVLLSAGCGRSRNGAGLSSRAPGTTATSAVTSKTSSTTSPGSTTAPGSTTVPTSPTTKPTTTTPSRFLYSANYGDQSISALTIDATTGA